MDRAELERLDRPTLIAQAEGAGVTRANILTRPELVDELLVRTARKDDLPRARGLFGRARDLVARVIEKGLHLPDAAERLRQVSVSATQTAARVAPAVVPTVTLAEIYAAQGHRSRAIDTLKRVMDVEPDHGAAQALLSKLETGPTTVPPAVAPPSPEEEDVLDGLTEPSESRLGSDASSPDPDLEGAAPSPGAQASVTEALTLPRDARDDGAGAQGTLEPAREAPSAPRTTTDRGEPLGFLDDEPLPIRYDVDECVAIAIDPTTLYVYWEVRESTLDHARRMREDGTLTLRLLVISPSWDGPRSATRDFDVDSAIANRVVRDLPIGAVVRAAIGWRSGETFLPIAHAPALETPPGAVWPVVADAFVRWTPRGLTPVTRLDPDFRSIGRALVRLNPRRDPDYDLATGPLGSSELSAGFSPTPDARPGAGNAPSSEALL